MFFPSFPFRISIRLADFASCKLHTLVCVTSLPRKQVADVSRIASICNISHGRVIGVVGRLDHTNCIATIHKGGNNVHLNGSTDTVHVNSIIHRLRPLSLIGYDDRFYRVAPTYQLGRTLSGTIRDFLARLSGCALTSLIRRGRPLCGLLLIR